MVMERKPREGKRPAQGIYLGFLDSLRFALSKILLFHRQSSQKTGSDFGVILSLAGADKLKLLT